MTAGEFSESGLLPAGSDRGWPAIVDGRFWVPPADHVLDHLVRQYLLVDDELTGLATDAESSEAGTVAVIYGELPSCDTCRQESRGEVPARYDSRAGSEGSAWGYLCEDCYLLYSPGQLGIGLGQYLISIDELAQGLEAAFERARAYWQQRGVDVPPYSPFSDED